MSVVLRVLAVGLLPIVFAGAQCAGPMFDTSSSRIPLPRPLDLVAPPDTDGDEIPDSLDNCPRIPNPDQEDTDANGFGNPCEPRPPSMPQIRVRTSMGNFVIELNDELAPLTVDNILRYVDEGFYTDTVVHRVDPAQGVVQWGGFDLDLNFKPTHEPVLWEGDNGLKNVRGSIGLARRTDPDSGTSQMYCNIRDNPGFDNDVSPPGFTVFGRVISGMDVVDRIADAELSTQPGSETLPIDPIIVTSIERI